LTLRPSTVLRVAMAVGVALLFSFFFFWSRSIILAQ
jgi:hypothetical protein